MGTTDTIYRLSNDDIYLLAEGAWYRSYQKLGAHPATVDGVAGYFFAVWVPDVRSVHVIGEFNGWDPTANPLEVTPYGGVWEAFVPGVQEGQLYKYLIETQSGDLLYKADPYAFSAEMIPGTASKTADIEGYVWGDKSWMDKRKKTNQMKAPLNIFEAHLGSWKRHDDGLAGNGDPDSDDHAGTYLTYEDLSVELVEYVKKMGYSHIEILPVMEHPFDGSWGYQITGYYAPTSRYGTPKQFKHFVDSCHKAGIGVILDWVPGGFCRDEHGLVHFNGHKLYEKEEHPNWGTFKFDFARGEVHSFLISNLLYWIDEYHADGIRMDGVTSMLYLNFGIDDPRLKKFNEKGTEEDLVSIEFIKGCNATIGKYCPDVLMIAEESTAWPLVTYPPEDGGLGFHLKWDMGWMNDTLHYMQSDFPYRPSNHGLLTFSIMYAFNENFVLPLSHDEVVHGKCSLITRMPGDYWRQFAGMRSLAFYQMTHPGAKLNFMGNEIAQFIEWRYYEGIQYFLTEQYEAHAHQQHFVAKLNAFYNSYPALWQRAYTHDGFEWINPDNAEQSIISYIRHGDKPKDDLFILINFDPATYEEYRVGLPYAGKWKEVFNTDAEEFGGSGVTNSGFVYETVENPCDGRDYCVTLRVPPIGGLILAYEGPLPAKKTRAKAHTKKASNKTTKRAAAKATTKPAAKSAAQPATKSAGKPAAKRATKSAAQPATKATAKSAAQPAAKSAGKPAAKPATKSADKAMVQPKAATTSLTTRPSAAKAIAKKTVESKTSITKTTAKRTTRQSKAK
ncbi:1,4-alpha-glucan branching enzyme [Coriobacteriaceae bacterium BV3Ac1]|uniref:1,4-alpha-glucan branching protein GlgB n=1 Tax=Olegusella massiliensis TaxID=1776381 RepID=UPI0003AD9426|nr:1,4-alpha-glucan branching protein GlgB [Olegusella massiliensis]ERL13371.1 1,4-alpha-glucan branching enzyme [Coriobacteriaceae bacterium BV3Ac1]